MDDKIEDFPHDPAIQIASGESMHCAARNAPLLFALALVGLAVGVAAAVAQATTTNVPMRRAISGISTVPVLINERVLLDFIVDSGASDVGIPADVVGTLIRTGTLQRSDFLGTETYVLADGSTAPSEVFRIRSLKVGALVIENVTGSIADGDAPLLLGQSFLGRFDS
jgi:predicted aspartyl protease